MNIGQCLCLSTTMMLVCIYVCVTAFISMLCCFLASSLAKEILMSKRHTWLNSKKLYCHMTNLINPVLGLFRFLIIPVTFWYEMATKHNLLIFRPAHLKHFVDELTWRQVDCGHRSFLPLHLDFVKNRNNFCRMLKFGLQIRIEIKPGIKDKCKKHFHMCELYFSSMERLLWWVSHSNYLNSCFSKTVCLHFQLWRKI